ncbi:GEVED domain-containing protein [Flavobacterium akiainvivens]|uniref:GEVED domain-containing protein n=1 Tax=Flavobacterium akiainvivens TaxID=1202724 RepID=UPI0006C8C4A7|nr:GEVED domain-containing protein [Flavobacterium akiainvivens]SFQ47135.1 Por secretion system C-terminal sorting domain-containing protein [Flavobacterium akiainvivens]
MKFFTIKKLKTLCAALLLLLGYATQAQNSYCVPTWGGWAANEPTEPITLVQLGQNGVNGINNASTEVLSSATPRYEDFSSTSMNVAKGQTYTLVVKGNTDGNNINYITVYFDWNGDGTFGNATPDDAAAQQVLTNQPEKHQHLTALVNSTGLDNLSVVHNIVIPTDAVTGAIRMRVVKNYNAPSNHPCSNPFTFGQVEDYTLNITEAGEEPSTGCANTEPGNNPGDTGCVSFTYNGQTVSYTTVRGADGNVWLQQNLGAEGVATAMDQDTAYGDLYQWGRWEDGHQKRTSATTSTAANPNNPDGLGSGQATYITSGWWNGNALTDTWAAATPEDATDINGCDPCKALGEGWVMPTQENWTVLVDAEDISNPATAFASNLKLPANGYRSSSDGGFTFVGQRGYYWSATPTGIGAKYLYVGTTIANPAAGAMRGQGAAVRCLKIAQQIQSVTVTTQNSVPATITTNGGTLQLVAAVNPTTASQNVTWSIATGSDFATVNATGLVTATANGTVTVRATSVADTTKFGEITVTVTNQVVPVTCSFAAVAVTGFNADVIAEGTGGNANNKATQPIDGANGYYAQDFVPANPHSSGASAAAYGAGLPNNGTISSDATAGLTFQLADYTANNALILRNSLTNTGTLTFTQQKKAEKVYVAWVSAEGTNNVDVTVNFADGTSQVFAAQQANDWWSDGAPQATVKADGPLGRVSVITTAGWAPVNSFSGLTQTYLFQKEFELSAANHNKLIASVSFAKETSANAATTTAVLGVSICETPQTPVAVTGVTVTTQNSVPATITTAGGTLQLAAAVTPADASQNVTWSIATGSEFATVSATGVVTAAANGTVTVRATSVADTTKFGEITVTVNIAATGECPSLTELYENFDTLTCCDLGVVPDCWESILINGSNQIISGTTPASGTSNVYMNGYGQGKIAIVVLPHFSNVSAGTHQFRFKVRANSGPGALDFGYITDIEDENTFVVIEALTISNSTYTSADAERTIAIPTTVPAGARLAIRNPGTSWAGFYWDDVYYEPIPPTTGNGITGYNFDIIANGVGNASQSSGIGLDEVNSRALVSLDFQATATSALPTYGLPVNGVINSAASAGVSYQLANYTGPNALYLTPSYVTGSANTASTGTLSFQAQNAEVVYILSAAAGGGSSNLPFTATVNFSDGTNQQASLNAKDWYNGTNFAIKGIGRVNRTNNNLEGDAENPRLYEHTIALTAANQTKTITGITFAFTGDSTAEYGNEIRFAILSVTTGEAVDDVLTVATTNNAPATITTNSGVLELDAFLNGSYTADITWSIVEGGTGHATVDMYGKVTAVANGTVIVRATSTTNPELHGEITITITNQVEGYCESYFVNGCSGLAISGVSTTGGTTNISNLSSGCSNDNSLTGYGDFTEQTVTAAAGDTVNFTVNFSGNTAYLSVWIDWNHDFIFSDDEREYFTGNAEATGTTTFAVTVPEDAELTATRIRIKAVNGWEGSGPCGYNSIGEVEDYTFTVVEPVAITGVTVATQNNVPATIVTENGTLQLVATVNPAEASQEVTWSITAGTAATVSATGLVTATANGTVTVRATSVEDTTQFDDIEIIVDVPGYCDVSVDYDVEPISLVQFANINNATSAVVDATPAYEDFTGMVANVIQGETYTITVKGNTVGQFEHDIRVFIDWNQDLEFDMETEYYWASLLPSTGTDNVTATIDIEIPATALAGNTRLRVIKDQWNIYEEGEFDACLNAYYGQVEDYTVNIAAAVPAQTVEVTTQNNVAAEITVIDGTLQLVATVAPDNATNQNVTWTIVSGAEYATVNANGVVTATGDGTVVVRATSVSNPEVFDEITIVISNQLTCEEQNPGATEPVTLVNFAGINNESAAAIGGAFTENFLSVTGTAARGEEYVLTVKGNTNGDFANTVTAYIDWNQNMNFSDEGETFEVGTLQNSTGTDAAEVTLAITIPETAALGNATLRIVKKRAEGEVPCNANLYGQTEYYTLTVTEAAGTGDFNLAAISVYPNPVVDVLNIEATEEVTLAEVYSTLGQRVLAGKGKTLNLMGLESGVYIVKVVLQNGVTQNIKIVKQ